MRTPGFIAGVTCTGLDLGNLPPLIHKMRVIPVDLNEVWAMEVDIEYSGGIVLDVETRIEVYEHELQKDSLDNSLRLRSSGEETSDLLEGIDLSSNLADQMENRDGESSLIYFMLTAGFVFILFPVKIISALYHGNFMGC